MSLDGVSDVHLQLYCTASLECELIFMSLDGVSDVHLQLYCTASLECELIFLSLDDVSDVRLQLYCTASLECELIFPSLGSVIDSFNSSVSRSKRFCLQLSGVARISPRGEANYHGGPKVTPYQKVKTHRILSTIFWEGPKITNKKKIKIKNNKKYHT